MLHCDTITMSAGSHGHTIRDRKGKTMEKRITKDSNGYYFVEIRFLPVEEWEQDEGWRAIYVTAIYEHAKAKLDSLKVGE